MNRQAKPAVLYLDDGYPESRDYDDNYVAVDPKQPRDLLRRLLRLPPVRLQREVGLPLAMRCEGREQTA